MTKPFFVHETYIRATQTQIWRALTTPEFTSQYFHATRVTSTWQPGDAVEYRRADGSVAVEGQVLEADPPNKLVISWHVLYDVAAAKEPPSRVTFEIDPASDGQCRLRMTHDEFVEGTVVLDNIRDGWPWIIASMKSLLETGTALPPAA